MKIINSYLLALRMNTRILAVLMMTLLFRCILIAQGAKVSRKFIRKLVKRQKKAKDKMNIKNTKKWKVSKKN